MTNNKPINPIGLYFPEISLISDSPRFQVIATNGVFEVLINTLIEKKCKNKKACKFNYGIKLVLLNEAGHLTDVH